MAFLAVGCGSSGQDPITVKTGSLSKAEFISRTNGVCSSVRTHFLQDFGHYYKAHPFKKATEEEWLEGELHETVLPNYEKRMIPAISAIGAPPSEKQKVVVFLESLQQRLDEIGGHLKILNESPFPFEKTAALAKKYGFKTCAESFG